MLRYMGVALCALSGALALIPRQDGDEPSTTSEEPESETHVVRVGWVCSCPFPPPGSI